MKRVRGIAVLVLILAAAAGAYFYETRPPVALVLTGIVTTNDVIVSPQVAGQIKELLVKEGDSVTRDQVIARITPDELRANSAYFMHSAEGATSEVQSSEAALRFQVQQTDQQVKQAQATLAAVEAGQKSAEADLRLATLIFDRDEALLRGGAVSQDDFDHARAGRDAAAAQLEVVKKQVEAARAAVALAQSNAEQTVMRRTQVQANEHGLAAAEAQLTKADVQLGYTDVRAPIDGLVDVRSVRAGEIVNPGQPIVTLVNPDDLWIRCDVEEGYIDRIKIGDTLTVRLPSGALRQGAVFFRGVDAGFATQRDVSRTKRDIKTFEVRLRVDNHDRALALGMTAYVMLPLK